MKPNAVRKPGEVSMLRSLFELKSHPMSRSFLSKSSKQRQLDRRQTTTDLPYEYTVLGHNEQARTNFPATMFDRALDELAKLKKNSRRLKSKDLDSKLECCMTERLARDTYESPKAIVRTKLYSEYSQTLMNVPAPKSERINRKIYRNDYSSLKPANTLIENLRDISPIPVRASKLPKLNSRSRVLKSIQVAVHV
mmetsp:Transcript_10206/g.19961  ORF Transcript_10206/g.19961 Transcript_10206/m.19961 type:complete len:195 (-) Transcript_10206:212-796(-)